MNAARLVMRAAVVASGALVSTVLCQKALAQPAPGNPAATERPPVVLVVPAAASGSADRFARVIASSLESVLETRVDVRNVPGARGVTGMQAVAKATPDGNTLGLAVSTPLMAGRLLSRDADYNPLEDFDYLAILGTYPNAVVVRDNHPARTFAEWLDYARRSPSPLVYGSAGVGSAGHFAGEYLRTEQRANVVHQVVTATADAYPMLTAGTMDVLFDGAPAAMAAAARGGYRMLALTSERRHPVTPDLPAFGEMWKGESFEIWIGLVTPTNLPPAVRSRLISALGVLIVDQRFIANLGGLGMQYTGVAGKDAREFVERDLLRQAKNVARFGIAMPR